MRKRKNVGIIAFLILVAWPALQGFDAQPEAFMKAVSGDRVEPGRFVRLFAHDDGTADIYAGSTSGEFIIANRFSADASVSLDAVSFYMSGWGAGDEVDVIIYENPTGMAPGPDPSMEVWSTTVELGIGGFQEVLTEDCPVLNPEGLRGAAFYVAVANVSGRSFKLGIDTMGPNRGSSYVSKDDGLTFARLSAIPIIDGNAMIRADGETALGSMDPSHNPASDLIWSRWTSQWRLKASHLSGAAKGVPRYDGTCLFCMDTSDEGVRVPETLINSNICAFSGSSSCPACAPALLEDFPSFTDQSDPDSDLYEDYITIKNSSAAAITMPIRTVLDTLEPVSVTGYNPDAGGGSPPDSYWEYSFTSQDGTSSADNTLETGEQITRMWQFANEGGEIFSFWVDVYAEDIDWFGDGRDGALVVTGTTYVDEDKSTLAEDASAGSRQLVVADGSSFSSGDVLFIINLQGPESGRYEFAQVSSVSDNTITLMGGLCRAYPTDHKVVVIRVPQYTNVTVQSGGSLTVSDWNGSIGGFAVFLVQNTLDVQVGGSIYLRGKGYRGGLKGYGGGQNHGARGGTWYGYSGVKDYHQWYGAGGGGHWYREGSSGPDAGAAGGGGGHGTEGAQGQQWSYAYGGRGGETYGTSNMSKIYFGAGGGGGGGDDDGSDQGDGGNGGDGGGSMIAYARSVVVNGSIDARGNNGANAWDPGDGEPGAGGGGAGGAVYIVSEAQTIADGAITVAGGAGGTVYYDGGAGGEGRIRLELVTK